MHVKRLHFTDKGFTTYIHHHITHLILLCYGIHQN